MKKLEILMIWNCRSIREVFESSSESSSTKKMRSCSAAAGAITTHLVVPQLSNLKEVSISECDLLPHVFTFSTLETLNQLKVFRVYNCKALTQVINYDVKQEEEDEINGKLASSSSSSSKGVGVEGVVVVFPRLERLILEDLPKLEGFFLGINNNNNIHFRWPSLDYVKIINCPEMSVFTSGGHSETPKLKYIHTDLGIHTIDDEECGLNFHGTNNQKNQFIFNIN